MSQIQATASTGSSKQAKVRTTWRTFEGWLAQGKRTLNTQQSQADNDAAKDYKTLSSVEKAKTSLKQYKTNKRAELEKAFYAKAREEWQDRLRKAGLKDEDWGTMTEAERKSVEKGLGAHLAAEAEKNGSVESTATTASAVQEAASASSMALVTSSGLLSAPKMFPSVSTSSVSSYASAASYEFVKPSELGSDDDGDDDPSETFNHATAALASEDDGELEVLSTNWRTFDGMPATSSSSSSAYAHHVPQYSTQQQQYGARPSIATHNTWTSSAESSRHTSASGSPTTSSSGLRNFPNLTSPGSFQAMLSPNTVTQPDAYSHSRLFEPSYTSASSVAAGSASASSSASARRPKLLHAATTASNVSVNTNVWTPPGVTSPTATLPPAISASSSASAAAAGALVKPKSSPSSSVSSTASTSTHTSVSTSTSASSYIGPILLEPSDTEDNNLDLDILTNVKSKPKTKDFDPAKLLSPEEAEQEAVDFERFKFETRITKIIEFHRIAAEREVRLGLEIMKMRLRDSSSSSTSDGTSGKDAEPSTALVKFSGSKNSGGKAIRDEERKRVAEHEEAMRRLQQEKEDERKLLVREERKRRRAALQLRLELGEKPVLSNGDRTSRETLNNPTWLDQYDTVQAVFDVPIPNGELEGVFGNGKRARSATITQSNSSPQPPQPQPQAQAPQQRVQSRGGGGGPTKPYPRAHSTKPYRPPPSPDVPIARPRPLPAAWGQIPFMQEEGAQEEDGEEDGEEEEGDEYEYEYEYEWQYDGDPSQAGYPPPHAGQPPSFHPEQQQQHGQQVYHPQQQVQHAHSPPQHQRQVHGQETFMPRMYDNEDHHSQHQLQQQHHQQQQQQQPNQFDNAYSPFPPRFGNYDEEVQLEIQRAMEQLTATPASSSSSFSNGGYGFGTNPSSSSVSDMGGYMSDTLGAYGQGGNGGRPGSGSPSEHGYATDSRYHGHQGHQASAHSHHMHQQQQQHHQHGGSMPISMANSTSSSASGMSIPMPGGGIGMSPLEVSTPRVGSNGHPWGSQQGAPGGNGGFGMMSKTPTKNSPLATRGGNMFGQAGGQQQQQQHQQQNQQQQQQGQQTMMGGWGRKNSMINTAMDESPAHSPNMGTATANPNNANNANTNGASTLTSGLSWAAKKFSLFGGSGSTPAPTAETSMDSKLPLDEDQDDDDDEEDEEEEEEEEVTPPPPPPPPAKSKKGGKNTTPAVVAQPPPPPPAQTTVKGKKGKGKTVPAVVEKEKPVEKPAPPPPAPAKETKEPAGKKGGAKKGRQATNKKATTTTKVEPEQPGPPAKQDEDEDDMSIPGGLGSSTGSLWDSDASASTPKPPAKGVNPSNWGAPPPTNVGPGGAGGGAGTNGLRKQMYQQQMAMQKQDGEDLVKPTGGNVVDEIPASVHESLWAKARASSATPTVAAASAGGRAAATPTPAAGKTGWKASGNGPSRLGNRSVFDSFEDEGKSFKTSTPAAARTKAASPAVGGGGATKKKAGGGPAKKVTIEEVSDEEDGVLDNSLPINYQGIMEPKSPDPMSRMPNIPDFVDLNAAAIAAAQSTANSSSSSSSAMNNAKSGAGSHMRQPKPSVPGAFNNLFEYGNGNSQQPGGASHSKRNWNDEDGFFSSNPASMMTTPSSTAPTSPEDGVMHGMSGDFLKKAQAQLSGKASSSSSAASAARGGAQGKKGMDAGFSTDWEGTVKANKRGAGAGAGSGWGKSLLSGVMSEDEMMGAGVPGGFSKPASAGGGGGGSAAPPPSMSIWEAGKQKQQAAKANGNGGPTNNASSGPGGKGAEADDLFARFAKSQQLEAMKRTGGSR